MISTCCCLCTTVTESTYISLPWKSFFTHKTYLRKCYMLPCTESNWRYPMKQCHEYEYGIMFTVFHWRQHTHYTYGVHIAFSYSFSVAYQIQSSRRQWELNKQILSLSYNHNSYAIRGKKVTRSGALMYDAAVCICQHINHMRQPVHSGYIHTSMVCPWVVLSLARNAAKVARPFLLDHNTTAVMLAILASLHGILWHCNSLCSCTYVHMHVSTYVYIP